MGFAILSAQNSGVMFPRWSGYFTLWVAALEMFSALSVFFYDGPFSYHGLVTFWVPAVSFFVWVLVLAVVQIRGSARVKDGMPESKAVESEEDSLAVDVLDTNSERVSETAGI